MSTISRFKGFLSDARSVAGEALRDWQSDNVSRLAASLAFYTSFSIAPALVIGLAVAGAFVGDLVAQTEFTDEIQQFVGAEATSFIVELVHSWRGRMSGRTATFIGIAVSLFGATAAFVEMQSAFNIIWKSEPSSRSFLKQALYERIVSFMLVLAIGVFLVISLFLGTTVAALNRSVALQLPVPAQLFQLINFLITLIMTTILVSTLFKLLPDRRLVWKDVWVGAVVTSLLLAFGKYLFAMYLAHTAISSLYGAAGSFAILLVWIYYNAHVLFFGAEISHAYVKQIRSRGEKVSQIQAQPITVSENSPDSIGSEEAPRIENPSETPEARGI